MARGNFVEREFRCCLCGARFTALAAIQPVPTPVCMDCGLQHGPEKLRRLISERVQPQARPPGKRRV